MEKVLERKEEKATKATKVNTRRITQIGMLAGIAVVLMLFELPMPFAPAFYKLDLSEVPVLIGTFAMGPVAGITIEFVKIMLNFIVDGSVTAGVGELANFLIGCMYIVPAGIIYNRNKSKKMAVIGMATGTVCMSIGACFLNAYILLPAYAKAFEMPIDALVGMGTALNANITDIFTFAIFAVAPFNLLKGVVVAVVVALIYKKISRVLH